MTEVPTYVPLSLETLSSELPTGWNLYIEAGGRYVLYREASLPFTRADRERLLNSGVSGLWIRLPMGGRCALRRAAPSHVILSDEEVPPVTKAGLLYTSAVSITQQVATLSATKESLLEAGDLVRNSIEYLAHSKRAFSAVLSVMMHEFSVYTHAVNVALYAVGLGRKAATMDQKALQDLGLGAFLHDVGKTRVPTEILYGITCRNNTIPARPEIPIDLSVPPCLRGELPPRRSCD